MSIRPSSAADTARLIADLSSSDALQRETASARLAVIGARAVTGLLAAAGDETRPASARAAALTALAASAAPRALTLALALVDHPDDAVAGAAIGVLGAIAGGHDRRSPQAFDRLTGLATDASRRAARRLAALDALGDRPARLLAPVYDMLSRDRAPEVAARAARRAAGAAGGETSIAAMAGGALPADPAVVAAVLREDGRDARLTHLRAIVEVVRVREGRARADEERSAWMAARGLAHQQLAARGSRLAVYDLRETLAAARGPLPVGFLAAAAAVGDATCLEPIAAAWIDTTAPERWWRGHLAEAFLAIVRRERLTRHAPVLKRILERWPAAGALVAAAPLRARTR